jgi:transposase
LNEKTFQRQYRDVLSGYDETTAPDDLLYEENLGKRLSIDDTGLVGRDGNTVIGNKDSGKLVSLISGTKASQVVEIMSQIPFTQRVKVEEISMDLSSSYDWATRVLFPNAIKIVDRFHVQKLVYEAMQSVRIRYRWEALKEAAERKGCQRRHSNGETDKELLARSRYLLFVPADKWSEAQRERATILFAAYPEMEIAYNFCQGLRSVYEGRISIDQARLTLHEWYGQAKNTGISEFKTCVQTIKRHEGRVLNYFRTRETNAFAESLNAKLKRFKGMCRGIRDATFFLFRVGLYFA